MTTTQPITILICALGGEGGGVLSEWLVAAAEQAGYAAQSTSIPGVAQRTGATTYYVEVFPVPFAQLNGRGPVFSLYPVPGALDLLVSSELLETVRQIGNGMSAVERTMVITSSSRSLTTLERMQMADGRVGEAPLIDVVRRFSRSHHVVDMSALTREAGTVVSAVMFGAIAASGVLPLARAQCEAVIRGAGRSAQASLDGFALAYARIAGERERTAFIAETIGAETANTASTADRGAAGMLVAPGQSPDMESQKSDPPIPSPALPDDVRRRFPAAIHPMLALGHARVREYQDAAYAALYLERVARIVDAERRADPEGAGRFAIATEIARYLALWMAFDDIVRVAELKSRASRNARVRSEVHVERAQLLRVYDHFKPGVPEAASLLPPRLADALVRWDRRRQSRGHAALAWPIRLGTHTVTGMLALRALAALKRLRPHGSRYAAEQQLIERWLETVERGTADSWTLGHELACCGRLIKGYGATNERGKANLLHIVDHLARAVAAPEQRAAAVRDARTAALADEAGAALDRTLLAHGAPPRPVKPVPIRFVRKPRAATVGSER